MDDRDLHYSDAERPKKRARSSPPPGPPYASASTAHATSSNGSSNGHTLPPLSLSILGVEPLDEFIREVADFVYEMLRTRPSGPGAVEVEAKIGVLRDKMSGQRVQLPVLVETILMPNALDSRFESNMSPMQHKHFNTLLNGLQTQRAATGTPIAHTHLRLVDSFYTPDSGARERIRVTRDEKTNTVTACVRKVRLGDLNVYSPKRAADWRISVSMEIPVPPPIGTATHTRRKDRMSYAHEEFVIDLTQVTSSANGKSEVLHELEVELARPEYLLATAAKRGDPSVPEPERAAFDELIRAFVNNARILVRNAGDGWQ
ncbi:mRNA capping enzyme [Amylocystis lapponica]|nr:mRNA capping enzyme [Amylocystis lapponica]